MGGGTVSSPEAFAIGGAFHQLMWKQGMKIGAKLEVASRAQLRHGSPLDRANRVVVVRPERRTGCRPMGGGIARS